MEHIKKFDRGFLVREKSATLGISYNEDGSISMVHTNITPNMSTKHGYILKSIDDVKQIINRKLDDDIKKAEQRKIDMNKILDTL